MPKTILLADDSVTIRKVVELTFSDTDIRVEAVGSGSEALQRIAAIEPDLVLADVAMPDQSGYEICRQVKSSQRPVPVVLLAGTFEPFDHDRARSCGADAHVVKPFESALLLEKVESLLSAPSLPPSGRTVSSDGELEDALDELATRPTPPEAETVSPAEAEPVAVPAEAEPVAVRVETEPGAVPAEAVTDEPGAARPAPPEPAVPLPEGPAEEAAAAPPRRAPGVNLTAEELDALARAVVERLSSDALREVAWEVVPELAEVIIRERIRQLEREIED